MPYKINLGDWSDIFAVPRSLVKKHLKLAKEDYIKVLLVILAGANECLDNSSISDICGVSESNIADALKYWENCGILKVTDSGEIFPAQSNDTVVGTKVPEKIDVVESTKEIKTQKVAKNVKIRSSEPIRMTPFEVSKRIESTDELKWVISESERLMGRFLTQTEVSVLVTMFDYANIPADIIVMAVEYCVSIDKANLRFIEKTAYSWVDSGFDTHQKVESHITSLVTQKNNESLIKSAFGIWDHSLTSKQKEFISLWLEDLKFSIEMVKLAYEKCVDNTGRLSFPYINKVLLKWRECSLNSPDDVAAHELKRTCETVSQTFNPKEFEDWSNYSVPDLSKKSGSKGK